MPSKTICLIDQTVESVIREYVSVKAARLSLDKKEKELKSELAKLVAPYREEFSEIAGASDGGLGPCPWLNFGGAEVRPVDYSGSGHISGDRLRERGVDPEIIGFATSATPYTQYNVRILED